MMPWTPYAPHAAVAHRAFCLHFAGNVRGPKCGHHVDKKPLRGYYGRRGDCCIASSVTYVVPLHLRFHRRHVLKVKQESKYVYAVTEIINPVTGAMEDATTDLLLNWAVELTAGNTNKASMWTPAHLPCPAAYLSVADSKDGAPASSTRAPM